jgi:NAD(P)H-hydrate epimerase
MRPVVTVDEMKAVDAAAQQRVSLETLVDRAGAAVAKSVLRQLGGAYGRRVVVVAGKGHNGDDGRVAAARLRRRGVGVTVVDAAAADGPLAPCDVVVDAAYGTGFRGDYRAPEGPTGAHVVAVDIPSGVNGDTGEAAAGAVRADATVTFAALKPGLLLGEGPDRSGSIEVVDIGLDVSGAGVHLVEDDDVATLLPRRPRNAHKWETALYVAAGSPGMMGSATFCSLAAMRAGAGMLQLGVPGAGPRDLPTSEVVAHGLPAERWDADVLAVVERCRALVVGPGLGRSEATAAAVRRLVAECPVPVLVDADGLNVLGRAREIAPLVAGRTTPVVLTPHDGEFSRLAGSGPWPDRLGSARDLAHRAGAVVLLKGSATIVTPPAGRSLISTSGSARLATAGTGDVLSGIIGAFLARGLPAVEAAALGAHAHGRAAGLGLPEGLLAGDLLELLPRWLSAVTAGAEGAEIAEIAERKVTP